MRDNGYREAMVGNISLYDVTGKRLHTIYIGEVPFWLLIQQRYHTHKKNTF